METSRPFFSRQGDGFSKGSYWAAEVGSCTVTSLLKESPGSQYASRIGK